jgi:hypothetical protein
MQKFNMRVLIEKNEFRNVFFLRSERKRYWNLRRKVMHNLLIRLCSYFFLLFESSVDLGLIIVEI